MTFPVEVVLKGRDFATTETVSIAHGDPASWSDDAVRDVLVAILRAIERAERPNTPADRGVVLRGFSWIVEPVREESDRRERRSAERMGVGPHAQENNDGQVVIAIEIPMGAAVAGPFAIPQSDLDTRIRRVLKTEAQLTSTSPTIH